MLCFYPPWAAAQLLPQFWQTTWDEKSWPKFCYSNGTHGESQNKWQLQLRVPTVWTWIWEQEKLVGFYNCVTQTIIQQIVSEKQIGNKIKMIKTKIYANSNKTKAVLKFEPWSFSFNLENAEHVILGYGEMLGVFFGRATAHGHGGSKFKTLQSGVN